MDHVIILQKLKHLIDQKAQNTHSCSKIQDETFFAALETVAFKTKGSGGRFWELRDYEE